MRIPANRNRRVHPRVFRVIRHIQLHGTERAETSLVRLAEVAELSPSRLMHIFTESVGVPLRPFLLRLRMQRATHALVHGHTVTEAAHLAGFADASHLARTVRRAFGITPRELVTSHLRVSTPVPDIPSERECVLSCEESHHCLAAFVA